MSNYSCRSTLAALRCLFSAVPSTLDATVCILLRFRSVSPGLVTSPANIIYHLGEGRGGISSWTMAIVTPITTNMACDRHFDTSLLEDGYPIRLEPPSKLTYSWRKAAFAKRRKTGQSSRKCSMPVQISSGFLSCHMPSFPPTLEEEQESPTELQTESDTSQSIVNHENYDSQHQSKSQIDTSNYPPLHIHRDSASTTASDSTASSPTTTVSLTESFNNTETPITSPDTPASSKSLSSFTLANAVHPPEKPEVWRQPPAPRALSRPSTGYKKPRNLKGLAVDTSSASAFGRALNTASLPLRPTQEPTMLSAPSSPTFVKPLKQPKRKGSNLCLSIVPPASHAPPIQQVLDVPPTPSLIKPHALRHFPSSPSLPLASPNAPPEGGMQLPPLAARRNVNVGFAEVPQEKDEDEPNYDIPQSAEPKPKAYPDGPICIYDPHVYLFQEPSVDIASQFGVVVNVASEVVNPFTQLEKAKSDEDAKPPSRSESSSPTTPKAVDAPLVQSPSQPEYHHIPWEHSTDIVPDLYGLVKLIDERVQEGKKVLVHCQLGVSRSASLIVAYGLYKNPTITVKEAYDAVKRRSKWISPNMGLIMQLTEFRSNLMKESAGMPKRGLSHRHQSSKSKIGPIAPTLASEPPTRRSHVSELKNEESGPRSAPLPPEAANNKALSIAIGKNGVIPGPSSAPSGFAWPTDHTQSRLVSDIAVTGNEPIPTSAPRAVESSLSSMSTPSLSSPHSQSSEGSSQLSAQPSQARPGLSADSQTQPHRALPPLHLKPLNLPISHIDRFHSSNAGLSSSVQSPRAAEFAMNPAKPPTPDDTFDLTSPRVANFQSLHNSLHPSPLPLSSLSHPPIHSVADTAPPISQQVPQRHSPKVKPIMPPSNLASVVNTSETSHPGHESQPSLNSLTSPRASEFAMTGVGPPQALQNDESMCLTYGRPRPPPRIPSARERAFASLHSPTTPLSQPAPKPSSLGSGPHEPALDASDRRKLRSKLGMSTSSSYDMRSEYVLSARARELVSLPSPRSPDDRRESFHSALTTQDDVDALMSPREFEFTKNPFEDALGLGVDAAPQSSIVGQQRCEAEEEKDPRSPVQNPGSSPIVRNIADAFS